MLKTNHLIPDGESLDLDSFVTAARAPDMRVNLTDEIRDRVAASRALLDEFVDDGRIIYGVTTSVGGFVNWLMPVVAAAYMVHVFEHARRRAETV